MVQRTRTTAALLLGAAVTAVSGCVAVDARPDTGRLPPSGGRAGPSSAVEPQIVQPPVRESLGAVAPAPGPAPERTPAPPPAKEVVRQAPQPQRERPRRRVVPRPPNVPLATAGPCELGRQYGDWAPDSPQNRLCEQAYGQ